MTKQITANIPSRTVGKNTYKAYTKIFICDDKGQWSHEFGSILECDVIDVCKKATNWSEIRNAHFRMDGFHS